MNFLADVRFGNSLGKESCFGIGLLGGVFEFIGNLGIHVDVLFHLVQSSDLLVFGLLAECRTRRRHRKQGRANDFLILTHELGVVVQYSLVLIMLHWSL